MTLAETDSIWRRPAKATPYGGDSGLEGSKNIGIQGRSKKFPHTIRLFPCGPNDSKTYAKLTRLSACSLPLAEFGPLTRQHLTSSQNETCKPGGGMINTETEVEDGRQRPHLGYVCKVP